MTRDYVAELRAMAGPEPRRPVPAPYRDQARSRRRDRIDVVLLTAYLVVGIVVVLAAVYALGWLVTS